MAGPEGVNVSGVISRMLLAALSIKEGRGFVFCCFCIASIVWHCMKRRVGVTLNKHNLHFRGMERHGEAMRLLDYGNE
jgi:hypothetical protein